MDIVVKKLSIQLLIIFSRVSQYHHLLSHQILLTKNNKQYVQEFMKIDAILWSGTLNPKLTINTIIAKENDVFINPYLKRAKQRQNNYSLHFDKVAMGMIGNKVMIHVKYGESINYKKLFNVSFQPIYNLQPETVRCHCTIKNDYRISIHLLYKYICGWFTIDTVRIGTVDIHHNIIYIKHDGCKMNLFIKNNTIIFSISSKNYELVRINYEFLINIIKDILHINNMHHYMIKNDIKSLTSLLTHDRSTDFIKGHLGSYLTNILKRHHDSFFDRLIIDKRVKLEKYIQIVDVKHKILYRFWIIKQICCPLVNDNMLDVCYLYRQLL